MSAEAIESALSDRRAPPATQGLLFRMAWRTRDIVAPFHVGLNESQIAQLGGISERQARRTLARLVSAGVLTVSQRGRENTYVITSPQHRTHPTAIDGQHRTYPTAIDSENTGRIRPVIPDVSDRSYRTYPTGSDDAFLEENKKIRNNPRTRAKADGFSPLPVNTAEAEADPSPPPPLPAPEYARRLWRGVSDRIRREIPSAEHARWIAGLYPSWRYDVDDNLVLAVQARTSYACELLNLRYSDRLQIALNSLLAPDRQIELRVIFEVPAHVQEMRDASR